MHMKCPSVNFWAVHRGPPISLPNNLHTPFHQFWGTGLARIPTISGQRGGPPVKKSFRQFLGSGMPHLSRRHSVNFWAAGCPLERKCVPKQALGGGGNRHQLDMSGRPAGLRSVTPWDPATHASPDPHPDPDPGPGPGRDADPGLGLGFEPFLLCHH